MASLNTDHAPADSHKENDPRDTTTLANRAAAEKAREKAEEEAENAPKPLATEAALSHGNEPSRGAKIDASIELEGNEC